VAPPPLPSKVSSLVSTCFNRTNVGGFGGICAVLIGHPFDLVKVRLQTAEKGVYTGALDVAKKSLARDGFKGLYRGVTAPLVGVTPMFAVSFWVSGLQIIDVGI
jgi:solute carrier family 25 carnitine/acylcarnitine transporter 20/29